MAVIEEESKKVRLENEIRLIELAERKRRNS